MKRSTAVDEAIRAMEAAVGERAAATIRLRLYVVGDTQQSNRAIVNTRRLCLEHFPARHELEVLNLQENPELAAKDQILAAPTLVKFDPPPLRRFIGDMSDTAKILAGLGLPLPSPG